MEMPGMHKNDLLINFHYKRHLATLDFNSQLMELVYKEKD